MALYSDTNFPRDNVGRVHHLCVKAGEVANRVITVGDSSRASMLASQLDGYPSQVLEIKSLRPGAFTTFTGKFNGVPVSIIATGIGVPNMDLMLRETRAVVEGKMVIIRFGTCGSIRADVPPGKIAIASPGSVFVHRNPDAFRKNGAHLDCYSVSEMVSSSVKVTECLKSSFISAFGNDIVVEGVNASTDSFYSSQGRYTPQFFDDKNQSLIEFVHSKNLGIITFEMETFHLFDLASVSVPPYTIEVGAAVIVLANRLNALVVETATLRRLEKEGGRAVLEAITSYQFE